MSTPVPVIEQTGGYPGTARGNQPRNGRSIEYYVDKSDPAGNDGFKWDWKSIGIVESAILALSLVFCVGMALSRMAAFAGICAASDGDTFQFKAARNEPLMARSSSDELFN